jgi:hypothetical protein
MALATTRDSSWGWAAKMPTEWPSCWGAWVAPMAVLALLVHPPGPRKAPSQLVRCVRHGTDGEQSDVARQGMAASVPQAVG